MKYFTYVVPGEVKEYVTMSELEIIKTYWPVWYKEKCEKYGHRFVDFTYNFDDCIQEWIIVNEAYESDV